MWTTLLRCVLNGKAQRVYSSLPEEARLDFEKVKAAVLSAYELVPKAYRQRFRRLKKPAYQTFVEFAREKESLLTVGVNVARLKILNSFDNYF